MSEAKTVWLPFFENFRISPGAAAFISATKRSPEGSKAIPRGSARSVANVLSVPSGANTRIASPPGPPSFPSVVTQRFPRPIKSEADGTLDGRESCRANKNTRCACRRKLEDDLISGVRGKEIACGVKGEAKTLPGKRTKRALGSVRRKFENGARYGGTVLIKRHDKHVACSINRDSFGCRVNSA